MKVALTTLVGDALDVVGAHVAFHLASGFDVVLLDRAPDGFDLGDDGRVRVVGGAGHAELVRAAVDEHGVEWVVPSAADEFWWPRGESMKDVLAVMPARYGVVQALVRTFAGSRRDPGAFSERMISRTSLRGREGAGGASLERLLRPIYRAEPGMVVDPGDWTLRGRRVPLRAWYPVEVLRFPADPVVPPDDVDARLADGSLVEDHRLRDVLRRLASDEGGELRFPIPSVVDDASYAVECMAVGEVDIPGLDRQIRELELRIAALEARFWPTVRRGLRRLARRPG